MKCGKLVSVRFLGGFVIYDVAEAGRKRSEHAGRFTVHVHYRYLRVHGTYRKDVKHCIHQSHDANAHDNDKLNKKRS